MLVLAVGSHWIILQTAAWTGMLFTYSQSSTFEEAFSKTFSGDYPCRLCKLVKSVQEKERQAETVKVESKLEFTFATGEPLLFPPASSRPSFVWTEHSDLRAPPPPVPPPRLA